MKRLIFRRVGSRLLHGLPSAVIVVEPVGLLRLEDVQPFFKNITWCTGYSQACRA